MLGRSTPKKVARSDTAADTVVDTTTAEGNLVRVQTPKFLSLVGSPANQIGFKVLRSSQGEPLMAQPLTHPLPHPIVRRTRRSDAGPVLCLTFPTGSTEESVGVALKNYGLDGYTVAQAEGVFTAMRSDLKSIAKDKTMQIKLSEDGLMATVARNDTGVQNPGDKPGITLAAVEFDATKFVSSEAQAWLTAEGVDGTLQEAQNSDACHVVRRSEIAQGEETRRMELSDGVTAIVIRSDMNDIPVGFIAVVSEAAYGGWGWGQMDFAASMADTEFSEQMGDAIRILESIIRNIVIYSSLPLDVRKELAIRALGQFGDYIGTVMDSLPRQLLVSVTRSANHQQEKTMTTQQASGSGATAATTVTEEKALTRTDIVEMIATGIAAALKPADAVQRNDTPGPEGAAAAATTAAAVVPPAAIEQPLTRADLKALVEEAVKPLNTAVEQLKGLTVVRSTEEHLQIAKPETVKDVFRGSLPGLRN